MQLLERFRDSLTADLEAHDTQNYCESSAKKWKKLRHLMIGLGLVTLAGTTYMALNPSAEADTFGVDFLDRGVEIAAEQMLSLTPLAGLASLGLLGAGAIAHVGLRHTESYMQHNFTETS